MILNNYWRTDGISHYTEAWCSITLSMCCVHAHSLDCPDNVPPLGDAYWSLRSMFLQRHFCSKSEVFHGCGNPMFCAEILMHRGEAPPKSMSRDYENWGRVVRHAFFFFSWIWSLSLSLSLSWSLHQTKNYGFHDLQNPHLRRPLKIYAVDSSSCKILSCFRMCALKACCVNWYE